MWCRSIEFGLPELRIFSHSPTSEDGRDAVTRWVRERCREPLGVNVAKLGERDPLKLQ